MPTLKSLKKNNDLQKKNTCPTNSDKCLIKLISNLSPLMISIWTPGSVW